MQIPIKLKDKDSGGEEWCLIELQGDLESRTQEEMKNKFIGDLHFTNQGIPVLIIGHHILYGKVQDLDKPFLYMKKSSRESSDFEEGMSVDKSHSDCEYVVQAVINKKLFFKTRPKPIIATMKAATT
ncbi:Chromosome transmission fidelity protein 8 [Halocaridina rubra]|uniref:Chromosome transmission fidelity protein 8 n=1 Tax=Halocaridina rubra TaxID=373956 RepID=A0AAN8ZZW7_HALRR